MKKYYFIITFIIFLSGKTIQAQIDSTLLKRIPQDTVKKVMNMDALYNRPFLKAGKLPVTLGGYMEVNWQHLSTDGVTQGHQFQFRRVSLFVASSVGKHIKFLSEIEFGNELDADAGGSEIEVEFAALDFELHPLLNVRGGMVLNPIGAFNQNHDGPKWEFTDRPIAMTQLLPATFSNPGFGIYGKKYVGKWMFGYELYLTGGLDNSIIQNDKNKTFLPEAKENPSRFVSSASGEPLVTGKIGIRHNSIGEFGFSYMGGVYNKWQSDGIILDKKRRCDVFDIDFNTMLQKLKTSIRAEWCWIFVNVPSTYSQQFGSKQQGGYLDIVQPVLKQKVFGWENAVFNVACRLEYVDWNVEHFNETGSNIADDLWSIMPGLSFRPVPQTVLRFSYRYQKQRDITGNPPATTGGFNFGLSTYF